MLAAEHVLALAGEAEEAHLAVASPADLLVDLHLGSLGGLNRRDGLAKSLSLGWLLDLHLAGRELRRLAALPFLVALAAEEVGVGASVELLAVGAELADGLVG